MKYEYYLDQHPALTWKRKCGDFESLATRLGDLGRSSAKVSVHHIREETGERSVGPFRRSPAVIEISPLGGIPACRPSLPIALLCLQIVLGGRHFWLAPVIKRLAMDGARFGKAMDCEHSRALRRFSVMRVRPGRARPGRVALRQC